jgi:hypothetical protein
MSKYFTLDKEMGVESSNSSTFTIYLFVAVMIISVVGFFRFINSAGERVSHYGTFRGESYTSESIVGNAARAMRNYGLSVGGASSIKYLGYKGSTRSFKPLDGPVEVSEWGLHEFEVKDLNHEKGNDAIIVVGFRGGYNRPRTKRYDVLVQSIRVVTREE